MDDEVTSPNASSLQRFSILSVNVITRLMSMTVPYIMRSFLTLQAYCLSLYESRRWTDLSDRIIDATTRQKLHCAWNCVEESV